MTEGQDFFNGAPTGTHSSSIFVQLEIGQSARGIYLGTVKSNDPDRPDQPLIFSPRAGRCFVWPGHFTLLQALAQLPKFTPVHIVRGRDAGKREVRTYTVSSWPVVPEAQRGPISLAEKAAIEELVKIRGARKEPPAPRVETAPEQTRDDDLPF